jgi:hypothetical protein
MASTHDAVGLVALFDRHPPAGKKRLEFEVWKHAVLERARGRGWRTTYVAAARAELMALKSWQSH